MNEQSFKPAWRSFYRHFLAIIACLAVVALVSAKTPLPAGYQKGLWIFFLLFLLCAAGDMIIRRMSLALIVRPDEIALEKGLIGRHSVEISTKNIRTIQVTQNAMQRILNVGDILVASAGTDQYEIYASSIADPHTVRNLMQFHERSPENSVNDTEKNGGE